MIIKKLKTIFILSGLLMITGCSLNTSSLKNSSSAIVENNEQYNVTEYPIYLNNQKIYGELYEPKNKLEKNPAVIISHGFGGSYTSNQTEAKELAKRGYLVYIYDFRGGGNNSKSDGSTTEMSILTEKEDLETVLKTIKNLKSVDKNQVYLIGKSQGGFVSSVVAAEHSEDITGLILIYPAFCISDDAKARFSSLDKIPDKIEHMGMTIGKKYYDDVYNYDIYDKIKNYKKHTLIIHGDKDEIVNIFYSKKAIKVYDDAYLKIIKNAGHGFKGKEINEELQYIFEYLK